MKILGIAVVVGLAVSIISRAHEEFSWLRNSARNEIVDGEKRRGEFSTKLLLRLHTRAYTFVVTHWIRPVRGNRAGASVVICVNNICGSLGWIDYASSSDKPRHSGARAA